MNEVLPLLLNLSDLERLLRSIVTARLLSVDLSSTWRTGHDLEDCFRRTIAAVAGDKPEQIAPNLADYLCELAQRDTSQALFLHLDEVAFFVIVLDHFFG